MKLSSSWSLLILLNLHHHPPHPRLLEAEALRGHGGHRSPPPSPRPAAGRDGSPQRHPRTENQRQVHKNMETNLLTSKDDRAKTKRLIGGNASVRKENWYQGLNEVK